MAASSVSVDLELRRRSSELVRFDKAITLCGNTDRIIRHRRFGYFLGINDTKWFRNVDDDLLEEGISQTFRSAALVERILSTEGISLPEIKVVRLSCQDGSPIKSPVKGDFEGKEPDSK